MTVPCPKCNENIDISRTITGDRIYCPYCGVMLFVQHSVGETILYEIGADDD